MNEMNTIQEITNDYISLARMKEERNIKRSAFKHGLVKHGSIRHKQWSADIERLTDSIDTLEWSLSIVEQAGGVWGDDGNFIPV